MPRVGIKISPLFFVGAIVCFFFTFAGVSCNTASAKALVGQFSSGSSGSSTGIDPAQINPCLDALNGVNIVTYSGLNLALGSKPSVLTSTPSACQQSSRSSTPSAPSSDQASVGSQLPFLIALIASALAAVAGILALVKVLRGRAPALLAALLGIVAIVLIVVGELQAKSIIFNKITSSSPGASSAAPFDISTILNFNIGIAFWAAIALLAIGVLLNTPAALMGPGGSAQPVYAANAPVVGPYPGPGGAGAPPPPSEGTGGASPPQGFS